MDRERERSKGVEQPVREENNHTSTWCSCSIAPIFFNLTLFYHVIQ